VKRIALMTALWIASSFGAWSGTITGTVRAEAPPEIAREGASGKYGSRALKLAERVDYSQLREFVVFIDQPFTNAPAAPATTVRIVTQKNAIFSPHVLPVVKGTTIEWPNNDEIFHNVFSMSEGNPFNLGLYKDPTNGAWPSVTFTNSGRVDVFCTIHSKMSCVILVLENPYFAATDNKGRYTIGKVPPGTYKLKAWHERLPAQTREITVPAQGEARLDFVLGPGRSSSP
jgi:plastocyanin